MEVVDIPSLETEAETAIQYIVEQTADLTSIEQMLSTSLELQTSIYVAILFCIGVTGACLVCFLLYKLLRKFF